MTYTFPGRTGAGAIFKILNDQTKMPSFETAMAHAKAEWA
jgi:hypothetical protein